MRCLVTAPNKVLCFHCSKVPVLAGWWPIHILTHDTNCRFPSSEWLKPKSKSCYNQQSVGLSVLVSSPTWCLRPDFLYCQTDAVFFIWCSLWLEDGSVIVSSIWHLYLQFYTSAFYTVSCQESGSLWMHLFSFTCNPIYKASVNPGTVQWIMP
jgi:hypothetical protein